MLSRRAVITTLMVAAAVVVGAVSLSAQDEAKEEKFFANIGGGGARALEISITGWSTISQRARLLGALDAEGQEAMMKILETLPQVGRVRVQGGRTSSAPIHYAYESKTSDGRRHIVVLAPRPITLGEARRNDQSLSYDLSMIELFVPTDGKKGTGAVVGGAQVEVDGETKRLKVTAYQATPAKLMNVYTK